MISQGRPSVSLEDIHRVATEADLAYHYLGVVKIPCLIKSPLRADKKPSFGLFSPDGEKVTYKDFSTGERGGIIGLLQKIWGISFQDALERIHNDFHNFNGSAEIVMSHHSPVSISRGNNDVVMECRTRKWRDYDIEYWESYGITLPWLKYANVYPISHKIITKNNKRYVFGADKYAYAFVEFKEGRVTLKIYQPFNRSGFKWSSKHDRSVISLWTKVPKTGERVCICSSLKDALCLWANTGIPSLAIQGEGYSISETAVIELKKRFDKVDILFDNDKAGLEDAEKLSKTTGFNNIVLPKINGQKDISDIYHSLKDKARFKEIILKLFNQ